MSDFENVSKWLNLNHLNLNCEKTKFRMTLTFLLITILLEDRRGQSSWDLNWTIN